MWCTADLNQAMMSPSLCISSSSPCRGMAAVVKLMEPARSWWPQIGCTNLQTTAVAAVATITRVHSARRKVCEFGGIPALVQLLIKGTAEAQGHAARSLGLLAENRNFAYEVTFEHADTVHPSNPKSHRMSPRNSF